MAFTNPLDSLRLPDNATPGVPGMALVTGDDIPADLQAYYTAAFDVDGVAAAILYFTNITNDYYYQVTLTPYGNLAWGKVSNSIVEESYRLTTGGVDIWLGFYGDSSPNLRIGSGGELNIFSSGGISLASDGAGGLSPFTMYTGTSIVNQGRGRVSLFGPSSVDSPNAGVAEALMVTLPTFTAKQGRAYRMTVDASSFVTTAGAFCFLNLRKNTGAGILAGTNIGGWADFTGNGAQVNPFHRAPIYRRTAADGNVSLGITGLTSAGSGRFAGGTYPYYVQMDDIGLAADYPNATVIP